MALLHRGCHLLDSSALADVANLVLRAELFRDGAQPLLAPGDEDAAPAPAHEEARNRGADPARAAGKEG
jgi:hypothetical protein